MKKIKNFENYIISEQGEITNTRTGRVLKQGKNQKGYCQLVLSKKGTSSTKSVHRLVFESYNGIIEDGFEINHIDGNKDNNHFSNLEAITHHENMTKAVDIGIIKSGSDCKLSKPVDRIDVMTNLVLESYGSARLAEKASGIPNSSISLACNGKRQTAGGYKWKFSK